MNERGVSLIEALLAVCILSAIALPMVNLLSGVSVGMQLSEDELRASSLAQNLLSEISQKYWDEKQIATKSKSKMIGSPSAIGLDSGETLSTADDIDDYNNASLTAIQKFGRAVTVEYVDFDAGGTMSKPASSHYKLVTVKIQWGNNHSRSYETVFANGTK